MTAEIDVFFLALPHGVTDFFPDQQDEVRP